MANIKTYDCNSKKQLTKNINVSEIKCKGKGHIHNTKIDLDHLNKVQEFMAYIGADWVKFSSGYRCSTHDKTVGGSGSGQHTKSTATDQYFRIGGKNGKIIPAKEVCCKAQDFGFKGIGYIDENYVHLDSRTSGTYRGDETKGRNNNIPNGDFYAYFGIAKDGKSTYTGTLPTLPSRGYFKKGDKGTQVKNLQKFLNWALDGKLDVDGIIGDKTIKAVKKFQDLVRIKIDGLFGKDSLKKAETFEK